MKKSKRLQPVLHLAERNRKMAEQALGQAQQQLLQEQQKMQQLQTYLDDYQEQARQQQQAGVQPVTLIRLQEFMSRMEVAIQQQREQMVISEQMLVQATQLWRAAQGRYQAMESLIERSRVQEAQAEDKQLQRAIDELIQNRRPPSN